MSFSEVSKDVVIFFGVRKVLLQIIQRVSLNDQLYTQEFQFLHIALLNS